MAGTIPLSMTQQQDQYGGPLAGGLLYFFVAGTVSTFQNAYQDITLTLAHPNPITLDATGRVPQLFLADGFIKIRLTDDAGVVQLVADNIQVVGSSSGSVTGGTIDPTTIYQTGDLKPRYDTGTHTGWVRCNGNTIGSSISGANELPSGELNSTQALFEHLWNVDPNLVVSGGARGANAHADWLANRTITLPDLRGAGVAGMDDMGATAAGRLTSTYFGADATVLGAVGGSEQHTLTVAQVPALSFSGSTSGDSPDHTHIASWGGTTSGHSADHTHVVGNQGTSFTYGGGIGGAASSGGANSSGVSNDHTHTYSGSGATSGVTVNHTHSYSGSTSGGGGAHAIVQRTMVATIYIKL